MRKQHLPLLLKMVESVFGKKVLSYAECTELSDAVFKKAGILVNVSTLRRCFGLVKTANTPSFSTLNALAVYCGYRSLHDLVIFQQVIKDQEEENALLHYVVSLFTQLQAADGNDPTYSNLVEHTLHFLQYQPRLIDAFQRAIAKTKHGQVYYFEQLINIDKLNGYYGRGLGFYLHEKRTKEAQVFGHALLALRGWLSLNDEAFSAHCEKVLSWGIGDDVHPFVCGRYFGTRVLKANLEKKDSSDILQEARSFYQALQPSEGYYRMFPGFELTFSTVLVLAGEWQEGLYYINKALRKKNQAMPGYVNRQYFQSFCLYKALALANLGKYSEAESIYQSLDTSGFYYFARQVLTLLYLKLGIQLKKKYHNHSQIEYLVQETGFVRLANDPNREVLPFRIEPWL